MKKLIMGSLAAALVICSAAGSVASETEVLTPNPDNSQVIVEVLTPNPDNSPKA